MKKILIAAVAAAVIASAGYLALRNKGSEPKWRTEKAVKGDIVSTVTATGTVNAVTTILVGTQVSGTIKRIYADFNSPVKKGELIAEIDPAIFEAQAEQSKASLLTARANVEKAEAGALDAKRQMERASVLYSKDLIARSEADTAETNYASAKAQVAAAKADEARSEAALRFSETNLRYTRILSPVDGIVVSRNVDVGQTVAASFQTPTLFTIAQDLTKMQIDANVGEADIGRVRKGAPAELSVDAYPELTFTGSVSQIRIAPIVVQNVVTYDVVIIVANPEFKLKPGMTANVSIIVAREKGVLKVPNAALRFRPADALKPSEYKGAGVWVIKGEKPERAGITTGINDEAFTQITSGDIGEGQEVIVEEKGKKTNSAGVPGFFR